MLLLIDNFDSFTFNLAQYFRVLGQTVQVRRSLDVTLEECIALQPSFIVIGPGPGVPCDAGVSLDLMHFFAGKIPLLGVCLGHQGIAELYGAKLRRAKRIMHGKESRVTHDGRGVFCGLPKAFTVVRYHSWVVDPGTLPACLEVSAWDEEGEIMAIRHRSLQVEGVQFHPESVLTQKGYDLLGNFLSTDVTHLDPL